MKKSKFKKVIAITMAATTMCLCVSSAVGAKAPDSGSIISPQNIAVTTTDSQLTLGSYGELSCYGTTQVQSGYTAEVIVELQQFNGGWGTIQTWSKKGGRSAMVNVNHYVIKGSYRLKLTHNAYNSSGTLVESIPKYSNTVKY